MLPDWQLPRGVNRGLWDYLHSSEMVETYDEQMAASPLAQWDIAYCLDRFGRPGRLIDLGCGTGRLTAALAPEGYDCVGVDLSEAMLALAGKRAGNEKVQFVQASLLELSRHFRAEFDYAACLFSTLGMIVGAQNRRYAVREIAAVLKPGGRLVLHAHHRYFRGLGWRGLWSGDLTMPQAYGGAPLTIHHFSRRELLRLVRQAGFELTDSQALILTPQGSLSTGRIFSCRSIYGYMLTVRKTG